MSRLNAPIQTIRVDVDGATFIDDENGPRITSTDLGPDGERKANIVIKAIDGLLDLFDREGIELDFAGEMLFGAVVRMLQHTGHTAEELCEWVGAVTKAKCDLTVNGVKSGKA